MLKDKKILLGVTASIAAYKSTHIVRLLKKLGASVRVIQTEASLDFVTSLVLSTLSENDVIVDIVDKETNQWNNHVELGLWADYMIIAPVTAKTMSKMVEGNCDNQLIASYLSAKCPVYFAPAMDLDMYKHPSTQNNIKKLQEFGNKLIPVNHGELASGLVGEGRMAEPEEIIEFLLNDINSDKELFGKNCLVTAGPTQENIDPVRFIGNRSSGKMGMAIANELAEKGAEVNLVMGPSNISSSHYNINQINVNSASQMYDEVEKVFLDSDISVFAAAVSDYKPIKTYSEKIKKSDGNMEIKLEKTKDILLDMSSDKKDHQFVVGFALETENEEENAIKKLQTKNLDMIILNSTKDKGATFGYDTNKISIIEKDLSVTNYDLKEKSEVAKDIVSSIIKKINK
ncbi:MAG: bifunctional phosphopantothenoylcysteine decarboxylase/phosphopantothenate--cysteine ligase CoaBC [Flavobacteriales bacterium]|nr:bifunctional phosphopantothenoylcysteine decarboxylase/phosphopantothenate--cysteine ligase CoaBC [Flavobacteriales bacterium]MBT5354753.1 bifunctional phosphopantothenoylcysteine decarboxylase/phosphopantothenate--cysteine ligase CoaBC [Flavobacteriales bacterium]MBT6698779.1 bifunctional phosphopantothenoylcysteine decarboxylase/phosphopantothenate--cysteine ligase CoaBC [Flavobacteriales bacterium]MBT6815862.1 bifunctional phosphopantothenoylcysteine decarboxylase/phosphopantothenate--cyst